MTHSFAPTTGVLMATGSIKAIKDVKIGDQVVATDPQTGKRFVRKVLAVHLNHDRALTDLTVRVNGHDAVIHTTQHHPFWDQTQNMWVNASDLILSDKLRTATATASGVVGVANFNGARDMYDLTVESTHTYYVIADTTPVLVHNCPTFFGKSFGGKPSAAEIADRGLREKAVPTRLGDLEGITTPDYGDPIKVAGASSMDDDILLQSINNPSGLGSTVTIDEEGAVIQGNHRMREILNRMANPGKPGITPDTIVKVIR
jgi:hypothetical protein